ncbi:hypothetical protein E3N88_04570 [Mikania micrantha]|uniref:Uncharacterized protein n=1 Tax=Mikania micrantha TaxID=192012 RepID=A0A5N6PVB6_9ASTR|nr:hypothetical protein E3N88_04570 [Mikania micrantha]
MESSSSRSTQGNENPRSSKNKENPRSTQKLQNPPRSKPYSRVLCVYYRAPTYYRCICKNWIHYCTTCDLQQPEAKEQPLPELTFEQLNPELNEDPDVLKMIYNSPPWSNDDCHWK